MMAHSNPASVGAKAADEHTVGNRPPGDSARAEASVSTEPSPDGRRDTWRFPSVLISVRMMRQRLRGFLRNKTALSDDETEDLLLAASEAANNAVEHAQQPTEPFFEVSSDVDDEQVTVVVQDHGGWQQPTSPTYRGRGLAMMRALVNTTVTTRPHGTTVTMRSRWHRREAKAEEG
jgi:anti-sigma regulatory factor (Ser/Thr protein kinase)